MPAVMTMPPVKHDWVELKGGWDQVTPRLSLPAGWLRDVNNFECAPTGGYTRIPGYERFDGRPKPSAATYTLVQVVTFVNEPALGDVVTQAGSGATGVVIVVVGASNYFIVTKVTGVFDDSNVITTPGPITIGTATPVTVVLTAKENAQYVNFAADEFRGDIVAVPGSGPIRGIASLIVAGVSEVYAFRDNVGATALDVYKASGSGWTQVIFFDEVSFTAGTPSIPAEGATVTQGGNTATLKRIATATGKFTGGDAAGRLIITTPTPSSFSAGAATITGGITVTISGAETAISLSTGGKFEFINANFAGQLGTLRIYGADAVNRMFEFDGTILVPITTGLTTDSPKHITAFKAHLFYSSQSSALFSAPGDPYRHAAGDKAGEIATGDTVTGFQEQPGAETVGALAIYQRNNTGVLYGTGLSDFNFSQFRTKTGGIDYTNQELDQSYVLDDRGIVNLQTSLNFGNFLQASLTEPIKTFIVSQRSKVAYSSINREKSQYRIFFTDASALYMTIVNGELLGSMQQTFFDIMFCALNTEEGNGDEINFVGANSTGHVYQLDVGSSFDGENIEALITLNWNTMGNARMRKRFRHGSVEVQGSFYARFKFGYFLGYASPEIEQSVDANVTAASLWDAFTWDDFSWDGKILSPTEVDITGTAENIEVTISSTEDYIQAFTLSSLFFHYTPRRALR